MPTDGLTHLWDASSVDGNPWKHQRSNILNPWLTWTSGTGSTAGYNPNGSGSEQFRTDTGFTTEGQYSGNVPSISVVDVVWRTQPDSASGADGGWNSDYYTIDTNYTYRYSIWVRRPTTATGGRMYHGMSPNPIRNDNGASQGNPYFSYPAQSAFEVGQWYCHIAHVHYEGYTGGRHPLTGWYKLKANITPGTSAPRVGDIESRYLEYLPSIDNYYGNCGDADQRWASGTTTARNRVYHFYTTNTSSALEFAYPRIDKIDGTEPSLNQLVTNAKFGLKNLIGVQRSGHGYINNLNGMNNWSYLEENGVEFLRYSGSSSHDFPMRMGFDYSSTNYTVIAITRYAPGGSPKGRIVSGRINNWLLGHWSDTTENHYAAGWVSGVDAGGTDTDWRIYAATGNISTDRYSFWVNGSKVVNNSTGGSAGPNGFGLMHYDPGNSEWTNGDIAYLAVYNRVLSDAEITKLYQSLKGRVGL
jgi:hypothetical protein